MVFLASKNMVLMKYPKNLTGVLLEILIQCRPKISVLFRNPKILTSKIGHGFLASRNMLLIKQARFWRVFYLKFWYNVGPISLFSLKKKKKKKISISHTNNMFLVSKTWFLRNTPRFRHLLILEFWYNVGAISLHSSKSPTFWQAKVGHGFLASKNMVLMKYPKILTGVLLDILIQCRPRTCN